MTVIQKVLQASVYVIGWTALRLRIGLQAPAPYYLPNVDKGR